MKMLGQFRLKDLVNALYAQGELMVRISDVDGDNFVLDKSGKEPQCWGCRGPFQADDRRIASGIFALCGLDHTQHRGTVDWKIVRGVYKDDLDLFEIEYSLSEFGADLASDNFYDIVSDGDSRLTAFSESGVDDHITN